MRRSARGERLVLAQAALGGEIGVWPCGGNADLIRLIPAASATAAGASERRWSVRAVDPDYILSEADFM